MNHFPLELVYQYSLRHRLSIRATVRLIGKCFYQYNENIRSVVIPASVKIIKGFAFCGCINLRFIKFNRNSRLRKIGWLSFTSTIIESIEIPSSVKYIGMYAFAFNKKLRSVTFHDKAKIRKIGIEAFSNCPLLDDMAKENLMKIKSSRCCNFL